jgi:cell division septum initiation protein DivIVA
MDILARLQQIEDIAQEAKSVPLSASVLVNRDEILEIVDAARNELPEEIKQARWIVRDREELLTKARRDAEAVIEKAHAERQWMVSETEVARAAREEADRLLDEANGRARQMRLEAEDYVDAKLAQYEVALERVRLDLERSIEQVQRGRERLRGGTVAEEEFGGAAAEPAPREHRDQQLYDAEGGDLVR